MCGEACLAGGLDGYRAVPFVRARPKVLGPEAVPGSKPTSFYSPAGEASLAAHQAAERRGKDSCGQAKHR